jgi:hypothetical protein
MVSAVLGLMRRGAGALVARRDEWLAVVAVVSLAVYGLSCRPAWHPSGKSIAFPYKDGDRSGIALYELETRQTRRLIEESGDRLSTAECVWAQGGRWLYALVDRSRHEPFKSGPSELEVVRIDSEGGTPQTLRRITGLKDAAPIVPPVLVDDRFLWVSPLQREADERQFALRLDLAGGDAQEMLVSRDAVTYLLDCARRGILSVRQAEKDGRLEIGRFDGRSGRVRRVLALNDMKVVDTASFPAAELDGSRLAIVVKQEDQATVRLFADDGRPIKRLPVPEGIKDCLFPVWVHGRIWCDVEEKAAAPTGKDTSGLLRVDVESGASQFVRLGHRGDGGLQASVSPDGRRIAVAAAGMEPLEGEPATALWIFDATAPDAPPVRVDLPPRVPAAAPPPGP